MSEDDGKSVVSRFLTLYARVRDWCDDDPQALFQLTASDKIFETHCKELRNVASRLKQLLGESETPFVSPVDLRFVRTFRDYEMRFEHVLESNFGGLAYLLESKRQPRLDRSLERTSSERKRGHVELNASIAAECLEEFFNSYRGRVALADMYRGLSGRDADEAESWTDLAIQYWDELRAVLEYDLEGVFRRRLLAPLTLVPSHVAARHDNPEKAPLFAKLNEANSAFVLNLPKATLALMRSTVETVLRANYGADAGDLSDKIDQARKALPPAANAAALHRLRKLANGVLHDGPDGLTDTAGVKDLEAELLSLLSVVRALIEEAPERRAR